MNYVADAYVTHDSLDELVAKRGKEGWSIHQILEVKHWDTAAVTVIWEASSASESVIPSQLAGALPSKCDDGHSFSVSSMDEVSRCEDCGITIEEFVGEHSQGLNT